MNRRAVKLEQSAALDGLACLEPGYLLVTTFMLCVTWWHHGDEIDQPFHLVMVEAIGKRIRAKSVFRCIISSLIQKGIPLVALNLLGQKFVVLRLELLNNVLIVQQFLDGAVVF